MGQYIFRMPRNTPRLSHAGLSEYLGRCFSRGIGTTVTVEKWEGGRISFRLYGLTLANFYPDDRVEFTEAGANDRHMATGAWLGQIAGDNGLGWVYRENWARYLFSPGNGRIKEPIAGATFQGHPAEAAERDAAIAASIAEANAELAAELRARNAAYPACQVCGSLLEESDDGQGYVHAFGYQADHAAVLAVARYGVTAQLETIRGEYSGSRQIPYFGLPASVGDTEAEAAEAARKIIDPDGTFGARLHVCAVAL